MARTLIVMALLVAGVTASGLQNEVAKAPSPDRTPQPSIRGVWRNIERVIPAVTNPGDRLDPFGHVPVGTQVNVQPGVMIFTERHYSRTTDIAVRPRPTSDYAAPDKPTLEELQARWGPFARLRVKLEGNSLSLTPFE